MSLEKDFETACFEHDITRLKTYLSNPDLDLSFSDDLPFRRACEGISNENSSLHVIQLLVEAGEKRNSLINVHACNEEAMKRLAGTPGSRADSVIDYLLALPPKKYGFFDLHGDQEHIINESLNH